MNRLAGEQRRLNARERAEVLLRQRREHFFKMRRRAQLIFLAHTLLCLGIGFAVGWLL